MDEMMQYIGMVGKVYRHFKGGVYTVIGVCRDSETFAPTIIYRNVDKGQTWCRPAKNFTETITRNGKTFPRFQLIDFKTIMKNQISYDAFINS